MPESGRAPQARLTPAGHGEPAEDLRLTLCQVGAWLYQRGFVVATDGNLSVRLDAQRILASPTGLSKGMLQPEDLVVTDLDGRVLEGRHAPSSELPMHLLIYRQRPDVGAVCHAHPPVATGFAAAGLALDKALLAESVLDLESVPLAPYATPGTVELASTLEPLIARYNAILMANHGVVTCGADLQTAYFRMELVEHLARVTLVTELLGRQALLSTAEVNRLLARRKQPPAAPTAVTAESADRRQRLVALLRELLEWLQQDSGTGGTH